MTTSHTVTYVGIPGAKEREVTREVFTVGSRILGTETTEDRWFEGEMRGWRWVRKTTDTKHFGHANEATAWIDEMFREHDVYNVQRSGGTKLVVLT